MSELVNRLFSSIAIVIIVVLASLVRTEVLALLIALLLFFAATEWWRLFSTNAQHGYLYAATLVVLYGVCSTLHISSVIVVGIVWWGIAIIMLGFFVLNATSLSLKKSIWHAVIGVCVMVPSMYALTVIREIGTEYFILIFVWVWSADVGGFLFGNALGKHKLLPQVSPNKTIEGALGGCLLVLFTTSIIYYVFLLDNYSLTESLLVAFIVSVVAIVGDLFESMVKRYCHVKDSGQLIPGHGGLLDRFDSLMAAAPIFAAFLITMPS